MTKKRFATTLIGFTLTFAMLCPLTACNVEEHAHSFGAWHEKTPATCTEAGEEEQACSCGEKQTRPINPRGHDFGGYEQTPTEHYKKCSRCEEESGRGEHNYNAGNACEVCGHEQTFTKSLEYSEILEGETVVAYAVAGYAEGAEQLAEITVPSYYEGKPVTAVAQGAFYLAETDETLKKVNLPATVTDIEANAFTNCVALEEINFPEGLKTIKNSAFWNTALQEAVLPTTLEQLADYAFYAIPALKKVTVNSAVAIGKAVFSNNTALEVVEFGENADVTFEDGVYYFNNDTALNKITVNGNVKLGTVTLSGCTDASVDLVYGDKVTEIPEKAMGAHQTTGNIFKAVTLGKNVKTIGKSAFRYCHNITKIILPDGVEEVGDDAFAGCTSLEEATIPTSVKRFGERALTTAKIIRYAGTTAQWAQIEFAGTSATPLYNGGVLYVDGQPCETLDLRGAEKISANAFYEADYTKIILGGELKELGVNCFSHLSAQGGMFGGGSEFANKLTQLVVLCKQLHVVSCFTNTFNADTEVFYYGTAEEMDANVTFTNSTAHRFMYSKKELTHYFYSQTEPQTAGNFWQFDGDGNVVKW